MRTLSLVQATAAVLFVSGTVAAGCSAGDDAKQGDEGYIVPADAATLFDGAAVCDQTLKRHVSVREGDLKDGLVRWACADVKGVEGADRGQEYCEYHAVHQGKRVTSIADVDTSKPLYCYFTSVYYDTDGNAFPGEIDQKLAAELSKPDNLGAPVDPDLVRMKASVNSRAAATTLIEDCSNIVPDLNEERQVACYMASLKANGEELKRTCRGVDLAKDEAKWKKAQELGAKIFSEGEPDYELQRDIVGCLSLHRAEHGGATYRNSDPMICGRVYRAKHECNCAWTALPDALPGFFFTGWTSDQMPVGCQRVKVDGEDYPHLTICKVPEAEVSEIELDLDYAEDLQKFCNDRFGKDLVMKAPLRAVEVPGSCDPDATQFCYEFTAGGTSGASSSGGASSSTGGGGGSTCAHDECTVGAKLEASCSDCVAKVCAADAFCCETEWDATCAGAVPSVCGKSCP